MSTVELTPPTDPNRSCILGFNGQTHYDPFLPSSPSDEELLELTRDFSPGLRSSHTPSPAPGTNRNGSGLQNPLPSQPILPSQVYQFSQSLLTNNGFPDPSAASESYDLNGIALTKNSFLSPNIYPVDNEYPQSNDQTGTLTFVDTLFQDTDFVLLPDPEEELASNFVTQQHDLFSLEPTSADTYRSEYTHRASTGTATHTSHLMSPVLTDKASPDSRAGAANSPLYGHGAGDKIRTSIVNMTGEEDNMDHIRVSGPMQHTPALTGSSMANSPDRTFMPLIARAASPVVRVESYSRGDSPARVAPLGQRSGSKRRGSTSSFLSVRQDDGIEDGEEDTRNFRSQHLDRPGLTTFLEGENVGTASEGRAGFDPEARAHISDVQVPNFKDQEESNQFSMKIADVEDWLARSETGSAVGGNESPSLAPQRPKGINGRQRAKSAADPNLSHANLMKLMADPSLTAGSHIPGPGLLINEESGNEESDSDAEGDESGEDEESTFESPRAAIDVDDPLYEGPQNCERNSSPPPLFRAKVWQDPWYDSTDPGARIQPVTSNEAMLRYNQYADSIETVSRVATWGTRRLSESDLEGLFNRFTFSEKDRSKPKGERRASFLSTAAKLIPKRKGSLLKRKESETSKVQPTRPPDVEQSKRNSVGSRKESLGVPGPLQRKTSLSKSPKSPRINTGSAVAAMGNQFATLGASGSISATGTPSPTNAWTSAKNVLKRSRSRSEFPGGPPSPVNLTGLWTKQGGPPMPALASPANITEGKIDPKGMAEHDDDDDDDADEEKGVTIDFSVRTDPVTPTLEGFRSNLRQLDPRLPVFMIERVAQEQLRRYKKLLDFKVKHVQAVRNQRCSSAKHCLELGGEPTYLPSKSTGKEPEPSHTGYSVTGPSPSDDDVKALAEGIVTPAQFPAGVPMPPVKRLPAEFECSLCFKVKKFHKPSDWSKHVHEDLQPFTCTFATCAEPKSFKRKADWVRHENERHRQLEWWQCNMNECTHKCYRKDNFVQHLVREHKLPEPRIKTAKTSKPAVRGPSNQRGRRLPGDDPNQADDSTDEIDQVWKLVEECRHETPKDPKDEPCKFCGNVCGSWKKLTVHLAKHMEQISMPVLTIVRDMDVTPETIVSPIEQRILPQTTNSPPMRRSIPEVSRHTSPYGPGGGNMNNTSAPFAPQAGGPFHRPHQSTYPPPVPPQSQPQKYPYPRGASYNPSYYSNDGSPSPQFNPANHHGGYTQLQTSRPDNMYNVMAVPLTSEPRSTSYMKEGVYPSVYTGQQHQHPQVFSNMPSEAPMYAYRAPVTSYPQQASMDAPVQLQYSPISGMAYSQGQTEPTLFPPQPLPSLPQQQQQQQQQQPEGYPYTQ